MAIELHHLHPSHDDELSRLKERIAELEEERRWRKFPEEKPEEWETVVVRLSNGSYDRAVYLSNGQGWDIGDGLYHKSEEVTHWMPLPSAPEGWRMKEIKIQHNVIDNSIKIELDPVSIHEGLREQIEAAKIEIEKKPFKPFDKFLQNFESRFCDVCFFGRPVVYAFQQHLCKECADNMYEIDNDKAKSLMPILKRKKSYEWWVQDRRRRVNEALYAAYGELAEYKVNDEEKNDLQH